MIPGVDANLSRKPEIRGDAAYLILTAPSSNSGNFYTDDKLLAAHGVTDLEQYPVKRGTTNFIPDFFVDRGGRKPDHARLAQCSQPGLRLPRRSPPRHR